MIDAIICAKDSGGTLPLCLTALERQRELGKVVIVTPKPDLETQNIANSFHKTEVLLEPEGYCLAWARRLGVEATAEEFVTYVDADVYLGENHLVQLKDEALRLLEYHPHVAVEGILNYCFNSRFSVPTRPYSPKMVLWGERGFTHNTLFRRETLMSWRPRFTFAWEDWLLTRHVHRSNGVWERFQQNARSIHHEDYGDFKRSTWDAAGRHLVFGTGQHRKIVLEAVGYLINSAKAVLVQKNPRYFLRGCKRSSGLVAGYFKWNKYMKLERGSKMRWSYGKIN